MKILKPIDKIEFGKNSGLTLAEIYQYQPSYIEWAIVNISDFKIDIEEFEKLPTPTTIGYRSGHFSTNLKITELTHENVYELMAMSDTLNANCGVQDIKDLIKEGFEIENISEFRFPEYIQEMNNRK